jgi:hypothetical protein
MTENEMAEFFHSTWTQAIKLVEENSTSQRGSKEKMITMFSRMMADAASDAFKEITGKHPRDVEKFKF